MKKRTAIRIGSYLATLVAVLGIYAYTGYQRADYYQHQLENNYQQSLTELNEYMSTIETTLEKSIYATTPSMVSEISMSLWRECSGAKSAMAKLPLSSLNLENTYKFLSQVGDFAMNLSNKLAGGNEISEEEHDTLVQFAQYAKDFSDTVDRMVALYSNGEYISGSGTIALNSEVQSVGLENGFSTTEEALVDYPTLIYDGPFSDHLVNQTPQMTKNLEEVSRNDAQSAVKDLSGVNTDDLAYQGMEESNLPCYVFTTETSTIGVTQKGGLLCYILNTAAIEESNVSTEDAIKNAEQFLEDNGFSDMTVSYYANNGNTLIINFAYEQNGVIFYSDLIKVGVALDDGRIVSFDGRGYLTNHKNRVLDMPQYGVEEAQAVLSPYLEVTSAREAVIPTTTDAEVYAYEFHCKSKSTGDEILVYIDTQTCQEEDILFLLYTDDGVFVK